MASATVQRKEPAPPEIVSVTLVLSPGEANDLCSAICSADQSGRPGLLAILRALYLVGVS